MFGKTAAVLVLAASCAMIGIAPSLAASQLGWYDTDSNAAHSRANLTEKVLTRSAVTKVKYRRSMTAPPPRSAGACGPESPYVAAPLPFGGRLYAVTSGKLSKYNPATGSLIWRSNLNRYQIYNSLAITSNLVIAGGIGCLSGGSEPGGIVEAFNASTGAHVWTAGNSGGTITDTVKAGSYIVTAGEDAAGYEATVLNLSNGTPVWNSTGCQGQYPPPALVVGLLVMTYGCDSQGSATIEARKLATGALVWSLPSGWNLQRGDFPGSAGTHLYATDPSGTVEDLNPQTGQEEYSLSQAVSTLAVDASRIYATCGSEGSYVCAYNISTGALEWQNTQLAPIYYSPTLAAEADGVLYLDTGIALNTATGQVIKKLWSPSPAANALAVGDGRIAVVSDPRVLDLYGLPGS
jgi:hypothetical protein